MTGWVPPYGFVHEVQRGRLVVRFADHGVSILHYQFYCVLAHFLRGCGGAIR